MNMLVPVNAERDIGKVLVSLGTLDLPKLAELVGRAEESGRPIEEVFLASGEVSRTDLMEAYLGAGLTPSITRLADLPEWSVVLNDKGGAFGSGSRDRSIAVIALEHDRAKRCFLIVSPDCAQARAHSMVPKMLSKNYRLAGTLRAEQNLLDLIYENWDQRRLSERSDKGDDEESEMQRLFDEIAREAYQLGASDIHITSLTGTGTIAARVHGELEHLRDMTHDRVYALCSTAYNTLVEAGSTMEGFNPLENQNAVIERHMPEGLVRFRYSGLTLAPNGFDVTLRIIPIGVTTTPKSLSELGYSRDQEEALERICSHSAGMILFAGTTGSGKSTTVATQLSKLAADRPGKKIRSVEEPVEFRIPGVFQTPVKRLKGDRSDFLNVLRQILRSDPDMLMIGEIRDGDTAELAIQSVMSGHLCMSTLHADGAPLCYDRLIGMGVNRNDLASVGLVVGLVYQKLVAVLCNDCKIPASSQAAQDRTSLRGVLKRTLKVTDTLDGIYLRNHDGCMKCKHRGITGRTVCAEILRPTPAMLRTISAADSGGLWKLWRATITDDRDDMTGRTAFEHALYKMKAGIVSPESIESEFHFLDESPFAGLADA